ncbi:FtsX-like permease family protein [Streptomyces sp. RFCAC02]|uniref:FtsX-like permease family protein n=1 Tax=Streptomyces sp. RFCAC02 TaxID=2499143 RepID=UPI0010204678|nr:FtsX-like permease family protein [Streptomyces sp. RFCAC02]
MSAFASWRRDLGIGVRFALAGGRSGAVRTVLTAVGVALGVAVLLLAASVPAFLQARSDREDARQPHWADVTMAAASDTVRFDTASTEYRGDHIGGLWLQPDAGARTTAEPPPGVDAFPGPGEMVVSPALGRLLDSDEGALLAERLDATRVGTIAPDGLSGPDELFYYIGTDTLADDEEFGGRVRDWGMSISSDPLGPELTLLIVIGCIVLLMPVAVFVATAVRIGGERRDRRLAALRLLGADAAMARRTAAGEALTGAVLGVLLGAALFLVARSRAESVSLRGYTSYSADLTPDPLLAAIVAVGVPLTSVLVTLFALRGVVIEPLGVVRQSGDRRLRLTWRVLPGVVGIALLAPFVVSFESTSAATFVQAGSGVVLILISATVVLPWLVERVVGRLRGGPVPWQLAVRRLQLGSGPAARAVSGITVAVAGATALSMLLAGSEEDQTTATGADSSRAQIEVTAYGTSQEEGERLADDMAAQDGVTEALFTLSGYFTTDTSYTEVRIADCATLAEMIRVDACADGDVFLAGTSGEDGSSYIPEPGETVVLPESSDEAATPVAPGDEGGTWTVPASAVITEPRVDPAGSTYEGVFATPAALDRELLDSPLTTVLVSVDAADTDVLERVRNVAWTYGRQVSTWQIQDTTQSEEIHSIRTGLLVGATAVMVLIAASMIVATVEQLRERKRLLSVLVAFGTRRSTLGLSVLWQSAVPVALGLLVASAVGTGLGALLMGMVDLPVGNWFAFWPMLAMGAGMIALVTLGSLPVLWRLMRPDGLRTE